MGLRAAVGPGGAHRGAWGARRVRATVAATVEPGARVRGEGGGGGEGGEGGGGGGAGGKGKKIKMLSTVDYKHEEKTQIEENH